MSNYRTEVKWLKEQVDMWRKGCEKAISKCKRLEEEVEGHLAINLELMTQYNEAEARTGRLRNCLKRLLVNRKLRWAEVGYPLKEADIRAIDAAHAILTETGMTPHQCNEEATS